MVKLILRFSYQRGKVPLFGEKAFVLLSGVVKVFSGQNLGVLKKISGVEILLL